jgi:hypothetical protein
MSDDFDRQRHGELVREGLARSKEKKRLEELEAKLAAATEATEPSESVTDLEQTGNESPEIESLPPEIKSDPLIDSGASIRSRTLEGIDPEIAALFTDEELAATEAEENAKAAAERKKKAFADIRANLRQKAMVKENLIAASVLRSEAEKKRLAELVSFRIDMPGNGAGHNGRNGIRIDGFLYAQGQVYTRPRAVFETLQSIFYKAWLQELTFSQLNQNQRGMSPQEVLARQIPRFEVPRQQDEAAA